MRKSIAGIAVISLCLHACKKERSFDPDASGSTGGGTTGTLLAKAVTQLGDDDSLSVFYEYDNQKRLVSYRYDGVVDGDNFTGESKLIRNTQGIVEKVVVKSNDLSAVGIDSLVYAVNYNTGSSRYTSSVLTFNEAGFTIKDSTAYSYNASGKLSQSEEFLDDGVSGGYSKISKTEYSYDATGNVSRVKNYGYNESTSLYEAYDEDVYQYDTKVNPLIIGNEAFLLGDPLFASPNNVIKDTYTDFQDASYNDVVTNVYTYNTNNKPLTATITYQSEGVPYPVAYTYK